MANITPEDGNLALTDAEKRIKAAVGIYQKRISKAYEDIEAAKADQAKVRMFCEHRITKSDSGAWGGDGHETCEICGAEI